MQEAEKACRVVLVLHSIGWHLHDCIITFISPAGKENGKELCKQCGCSRAICQRTTALTDRLLRVSAGWWVTIDTCTEELFQSWWSTAKSQGEICVISHIFQRAKVDTVSCSTMFEKSYKKSYLNPNSPKIKKLKNQEKFDFGGIRVQRVDVHCSSTKKSLKMVEFLAKQKFYYCKNINQ